MRKQCIVCGCDESCCAEDTQPTPALLAELRRARQKIDEADGVTVESLRRELARAREQLLDCEQRFEEIARIIFPTEGS